MALLVCVFVVAPLSRHGLHLMLRDQETWRLFDQLFLHQNGTAKLLPGIFPHTSQGPLPDGSTWTIPFEIMCYVLVVALGVSGVLRRRWLLPVLFLADLAVTFWPNRPGQLIVHYLGDVAPMLILSSYFLSGAIFYVFRDKIPHSPAWFTVALLGFGFFAFVPPMLPMDGTFYQIALMTFGFYILFYIAFSPAIKLDRFGKHGDFSYGVYLYAWPVQQLLVQFFGPHLTPPRLFLLAWALTVPLAFLSWHLVEKPFLRLKPRPTHQIADETPAETARDTALSPAP